MRARISSFYLPLAILSLLLISPEVTAEFRCTSDISYKWVKRQPAPTPHFEGVVKPGGQAQAPSPTLTPPPPPTPEPTIVRLLGLERGGNDEASARAALQMESDRQRSRASDACKRDHEAFGTCVALKTNYHANILNSLSFSARLEVEKALSEECRHQEGTCLGVDVSEPQCRQIATAQPSVSPAPEKPADTKGVKEPAKDGKKK
jgi:hypothetical protein